MYFKPKCEQKALSRLIKKVNKRKQWKKYIQANSENSETLKKIDVLYFAEVCMT